MISKQRTNRLKSIFVFANAGYSGTALNLLKVIRRAANYLHYKLFILIVDFRKFGINGASIRP